MRIRKVEVFECLDSFFQRVIMITTGELWYGREWLWPALSRAELAAVLVFIYFIFSLNPFVVLPAGKSPDFQTRFKSAALDS